MERAALLGLRAADVEERFELRPQLHRHLHLHPLGAEVVHLDHIHQHRRRHVDRAFPLEGDRLFGDEPMVIANVMQIRIGQLEGSPEAGARVDAEHFQRPIEEPEHVAIQIATVVVVEAETMSLGAGHLAAGLAQEEEVLTFDDDRVGNAAGHRGAAVSDETLVLVRWRVLSMHIGRGRKVRARLEADTPRRNVVCVSHTCWRSYEYSMR